MMNPSSLFDSVAHKPFQPEHPTFSLPFEAICAELKRAYPKGVDVVVVTQASQPGWSVVPNDKGIIAILIGLLLPAVQKVRAADGSVVPAGLLKPGGKFGVARSINMTYGPIEFN